MKTTAEQFRDEFDAARRRLLALVDRPGITNLAIAAQTVAEFKRLVELRDRLS